MDYLRRSKLEIGVTSGEHPLTVMIPFDFYSKYVRTEDPCLTNNKCSKPDTEHLSVAMLSEQLLGSGEPSYISRWCHRSAGTKHYGRPSTFRFDTFQRPC